MPSVGIELTALQQTKLRRRFVISSSGLVGNLEHIVMHLQKLHYHYPDPFYLEIPAVYCHVRWFF